MSTNIDELLNTYNIESDSDSDSEESKYKQEMKIFDMSLPLEARIKALNSIDPNDVFNIIARLKSMYQMSGTSILEDFLYKVCFDSSILPFFKFEVSKSLIEYEVFCDSDIQEEINTCDKKQKKLLKRAYLCLNHVCSNMSDMETPCRVEAIFLLMQNKEYKSESESYFKSFLTDFNIECEYRYRTLVSIEKTIKNDLTNAICKEFSKKEFQSYALIYKDIVYPKDTVLRSRDHFSFIDSLPIDIIKKIYFKKYTDTEVYLEYFLLKGQLDFLFCENNMTSYRNLSGQYLLKMCDIDQTTRKVVENQILSFAQDKYLDYNIRADSADILIRLGSGKMKEYGKNVIEELGNVNGKAMTVFDNAQNVHAEQVDTSVLESLEFLNTLPEHKMKDGSVLTFETIEKKIKDLLKTESDKENNCYTCDKSSKPDAMLTVRQVFDKEYKFCSDKCFVKCTRDLKILRSLNRIYLDRALYSRFNSTLKNILVKVYSYTLSKEPDVRQEMFNRILEELEEMCDTCSSGFASRLINVISGFSDHGIKISFEDQICSNLAARLNHYIQNISSEDSIFRSKKLHDVIKLCIKNNETWLKSVKDTFLLKTVNDDKNEEWNKIIDTFLEKDKQVRIDQCLDTFTDMVLSEMTIPSSEYDKRQGFLMFFRTYMSTIREELYEEFKNDISDTDFDLYFRKSLSKYEGEF